MSRLFATDQNVNPDLALLLAKIRACRFCRDEGGAQALPHEPRPVLQVSGTPGSARIIITGQAPGTRVHASGRPFTDPSGDRLRQWLGMDEETFYDETRVSIVPMGFCFPGLDARGADKPPRAECRQLWHDALFAALPPPELIICIGQYAVDYHFKRLGLLPFRAARLTETIANWRAVLAASPVPLLVLPHPSWRNNGWLRKNAWFELDLLPVLQHQVRSILASYL